MLLWRFTDYLDKRRQDKKYLNMTFPFVNPLSHVRYVLDSSDTSCHTLVDLKVWHALIQRYSLKIEELKLMHSLRICDAIQATGS